MKKGMMKMEQNERNYGRKVIRDGSGIRVNRKSNKYVKKFFLTMGICFLLGAILGSIITGIIVHNHDSKQMNRITISADETEVILNSMYGAGNNTVSGQTTVFEWTRNDSLFEEAEFIPLNVPMDADLQEFVFILSRAYNIDWTLVMAIIDHESSFRPEVVSETHDYGLMQINQSNHQWLSENLGVTDFLDEEQNIRCGIYVLNQLFEEFNGNTHMVLMSYNLGESAAMKLWSGGVHSTPYSEEITARQAEFQEYINQERTGEENDN
jgi:hypothetical protein